MMHKMRFPYHLWHPSNMSFLFFGPLNIVAAPLGRATPAASLKGVLPSVSSTLQLAWKRVDFDDFEWFGDGSKPWYLVNPKIAGKWMFIPLKMVLIGIDPYPFSWLFEGFDDWMNHEPLKFWMCVFVCFFFPRVFWWSRGLAGGFSHTAATI